MLGGFLILVWAFWWVLAGKIGIKVWFLFVRQAERSRALGRGGGFVFGMYVVRPGEAGHDGNVFRE